MQLTKNATKKSFFLLLQINFSFLLIFSKVYVYIFWMAWQEVWLSYLVEACPFQYYGLLGLHGHGQCYFWGHHCYCPSTRQCWLLTQHHCLGQKKSLKTLCFFIFSSKKWLDGVYEIVFRFLTKFTDFLVINYLEIPISLRKHWLEFILVLVTLVFWIQMFRVYMKFNLY